MSGNLAGVRPEQIELVADDWPLLLQLVNQLTELQLVEVRVVELGHLKGRCYGRQWPELLLMESGRRETRWRLKISRGI